MLDEVRLQRLLPGVGVPAVLAVDLAEGVPAAQRRQRHPTEQLVAHEDPEGAHVAGHRRRAVVDAARPYLGTRLGAGRQQRPLVQQRGVDLTDQLAEPLHEVAELLGPGLLAHRLAQRPVGVGEVTQQHALGADEVVGTDVLGEGRSALVHVPDHGLRRQLVLRHPRVALGVGGVRLLEQLRQRPRVRHLLQQLHPLLVLHAVGLHGLDGLAPRGESLGVEHLAGVVERGLDHRHHVEGVLGRSLVEQLDRGEGERRQRLVEREVALQVHRQAHRPPVGCGRLHPLDHARCEQGTVR